LAAQQQLDARWFFFFGLGRCGRTGTASGSIGCTIGLGATASSGTGVGVGADAAAVAGASTKVSITSSGFAWSAVAELQASAAIKAHAIAMRLQGKQASKEKTLCGGFVCTFANNNDSCLQTVLRAITICNILTLTAEPRHHVCPIDSQRQISQYATGIGADRHPLLYRASRGKRRYNTHNRHGKP
jgi:hypothetical protein